MEKGGRPVPAFVRVGRPPFSYLMYHVFPSAIRRFGWLMEHGPLPALSAPLIEYAVRGDIGRKNRLQ